MTLDIPPGSGDEMLTRSLTALENIAGSFPVRLPIAISGLFTVLFYSASWFSRLSTFAVTLIGLGYPIESSIDLSGLQNWTGRPGCLLLSSACTQTGTWFLISCSHISPQSEECFQIFSFVWHFLSFINRSTETSYYTTPTQLLVSKCFIKMYSRINFVSPYLISFI